MAVIAKDLAVIAAATSLAILYCCVNVAECGQCVMYGRCDGGSAEDLKQKSAPCVYDGLGKQLDGDSRSVLDEVCPRLQGAGDDLCCDPDQVSDLKSALDEAAAIGLSNCPGCFENFRRIFCEMTCSSRQSDFLRVVKEEKVSAGKKRKVVRLEYHLNQDFAGNSYSSCRGVQSNVPGVPAMDLMCGLWAGNCSPRKWLDFLGSTYDEGGFSPVKIDFKLQSDRELVVDGGDQVRPLEAKVVKC